jgi:hypothetical protein
MGNLSLIKFHTADRSSAPLNADTASCRDLPFRESI